MTALHGFEQTRQRRIDELDAVLYEYTHAASGARLCWLEREDENKSFCAACCWKIRIPPKSSCARRRSAARNGRSANARRCKIRL